MNRTLALDIATRTGYSHSSGISGSWLLKKASELPMNRIIGVWDKLNHVRYNFGVEHVVAEAAHVGFAKAAIVLLELRGAVMAWCSHHGVSFNGDYSPKTIKKFATGSGKSDKAAMIVAASRLSGRDIQQEDEADAICLLYCHLSTLTNS